MVDLQRQLLERLKREDLIRILDEYYTNNGRPEDRRPKYREYAIQELKKCITLFGIQLAEE
jgi:hypothetical protein